MTGSLAANLLVAVVPWLKPDEFLGGLGNSAFGHMPTAAITTDIEFKNAFVFKQIQAVFNRLSTASALIYNALLTQSVSPNKFRVLHEYFQERFLFILWLGYRVTALIACPQFLIATRVLAQCVIVHRFLLPSHATLSATLSRS